MKKLFPRLRTALVLLLALGLAACMLPTSIQKIRENPRDFEGKTVTVSGSVKDVVSLLVVKYFEVDDGSGTLGVVSDKPMPVKGSKVTVTGKVREVASLGNKSLLLLIEDGAKTAENLK
jgi:starvation-inducible outer membrane lipoprotein